VSVVLNRAELLQPLPLLHQFLRQQQHRLLHRGRVERGKVLPNQWRQK
jgi:hypothetical protein